MNTGFIIIHRRLLEWEWYDDINVKVLFIHCLLKANYKPKRWQGINIDVGQFVTSYGKLSMQTGLSIQMVRTCLKKLESTNELTIKTTSRNTVITVVKYMDYQSKQHTNNNQSTNEQQTSNNQSTTTNKDNKENNVNKETKDKKKTIFPFRQSLIDLGVEEQVAEDWMKVRKTKKATNTETSFNRIKSQIHKSGKDPNDCITLAVAKDWKGFEASWIINETKKQNEQLTKSEQRLNALKEDW